MQYKAHQICSELCEGYIYSYNDGLNMETIDKINTPNDHKRLYLVSIIRCIQVLMWFEYQRFSLCHFADYTVDCHEVLRRPWRTLDFSSVSKSALMLIAAGPSDELD